MNKDRVATHPGAILIEDFLKPHGLSMNALAIKLSLANPHIWEVVHGKRRVTANLALRLARFFGNSAEFWMNLQSAYDLSVAKAETGTAIEREVLPLEQTHISR